MVYAGSPTIQKINKQVEGKIELIKKLWNKEVKQERLPIEH